MFCKNDKKSKLYLFLEFYIFFIYYFSTPFIAETKYQDISQLSDEDRELLKKLMFLSSFQAFVAAVSQIEGLQTMKQIISENVFFPIKIFHQQIISIVPHQIIQIQL